MNELNYSSRMSSEEQNVLRVMVLTYLLVFIYGQTSTGHRELQDEHCKQDQHVLDQV